MQAQAWAHMEAKQGDTSVVRGLLRCGLKASPKSRYVHLAWAEWERLQGSPDTARFLLKRGCSLNPHDPALSVVRGPRTDDREVDSSVPVSNSGLVQPQLGRRVSLGPHIPALSVVHAPAQAVLRYSWASGNCTETHGAPAVRPPVRLISLCGATLGPHRQLATAIQLPHGHRYGRHSGQPLDAALHHKRCMSSCAGRPDAGGLVPIRQ